jgi:ribosomal protein L44E
VSVNPEFSLQYVAMSATDGLFGGNRRTFVVEAAIGGSTRPPSQPIERHTGRARFSLVCCCCGPFSLRGQGRYACSNHVTNGS